MANLLLHPMPAPAPSPTAAASPQPTVATAHEARRVAADLAVLIGRGPLQRSIHATTTWARTPEHEQDILRRLDGLTPAWILRRRLLCSRRAELEQAQSWSQHVVLNKPRAATPFDLEQQARASGAAILMFARLARSTSDRVPHQVMNRARWLLEGSILPITSMERLAAQFIVDGQTGAEARALVELVSD